MFGFARMLANVPAGLFMTNHLARALIVAPVLLLAGALLMALGGSFAALMLGRALMGVGHTLTTLGALTAILRHRAGPRLASSLSAMEFAAMLGVLAGPGSSPCCRARCPGTPPGSWPARPSRPAWCWCPCWSARCREPDGDEIRPFFARSEGAADPVAPPTVAAVAGRGWLGLLAVVAGGAVAVSYSTVEQFTIPLRGSREFGLDRAGIARLLMLSQAADLVALLPLGALADRRGTARVLGGVFLLFAVALGLVGFGRPAADDRGLRALRRLHGRLDAAARHPPLGDAARAGGVADGALPRRGRRRHVRGALRGRPALGAPRRRPAGHHDRGHGHGRRGAARRRAGYRTLAMSRTVVSVTSRVLMPSPRIWRRTLCVSLVLPPRTTGRPFGTTRSAAASVNSTAPVPSAAR